MTITESAQKKVDQTLNGEGFLGIHLEGGGCSGYQIKLISIHRPTIRRADVVLDNIL